jgi:hypothetical protein
MAIHIPTSSLTRRILYGTAAILVFMMLVWWRPDIAQKKWFDSTRLDSSVWSSSSSLDIVVSMYKEDIHTVRETLRSIRSLPPIANVSEIRTFIYVKDPDANITTLQETLTTPNVIRLPNVGRESGSFLTHIIENWDNLAQHTLFVQAEPHEFEGLKNRILDYFMPSTGVLPLGTLEVCDCTSCNDPWNADRTFYRIEELYSILNGKFCPTNVMLTYLGQIMASRERIHMRSRELYEYLRETLESGKDHFIHKDNEGVSQDRDFFTDGPTNPYFGHTIERAWMLLWGCETPDMQCTGWNSLRIKREGEADDHCQCLDW